MKRKRSGLVFVALAAGLAVSPGALAQYEIVSNRPGTFVDISGTGTALGGGDDVNYIFTSTVGNAIFPAGQCAVTTNGHLSSGSINGGTAYVNGAIGPSGVPTGMIAGSTGRLVPWWDDLMTDFGDTTSQIYWQEIGGVLIVQWNRTSHFAAVAGEIVTFQVKVFSNVASGTYAQYIYQDAAFGGSHAANDYGASATIGYVADANASASNIQYTFNTANAVADGTVLSVIQGIVGACCRTNGTCVSTTASSCASQGGTYHGDGSLCAVQNCPVTELVTNGGFESGDFTGWTQWGNTGFTGVGDVNTGIHPPHGGTYSAFFGPIGTHGGIDQTIPLQAGQQATLRFWHRCDPSTPNYFLVSLGGETLVELVDDVAHPDWTEFSFQVAPSGANPVLHFETQHNPAWISLDDISMSLVGGPTCYPNCDGSTTAPCLNVTDFGCFLNEFAAGSSYANCDGSTVVPVLTVQDFGCFLNEFAAGCGTNC